MEEITDVSSHIRVQRLGAKPQGRQLRVHSRGAADREQAVQGVLPSLQETLHPLQWFLGRGGQLRDGARRNKGCRSTKNIYKIPQ